MSGAIFTPDQMKKREEWARNASNNRELGYRCFETAHDYVVNVFNRIGGASSFPTDDVNLQELAVAIGLMNEAFFAAYEDKTVVLK